jgi:hypothetical protein
MFIVRDIFTYILGLTKKPKYYWMKPTARVCCLMQNRRGYYPTLPAKLTASFLKRAMIHLQTMKNHYQQVWEQRNGKPGTKNLKCMSPAASVKY